MIIVSQKAKVRDYEILARYTLFEELCYGVNKRRSNRSNCHEVHIVHKPKNVYYRL